MKDWKAFWDQQATALSQSLQVARIKDGKPLDAAMMQRIGHHLSIQLRLEPTDHLLDVCCGNGLLSKAIKPHCASVVGVDFSEVLIQEARQDQTAGIAFHAGDARNFQLNQQFDKVLLYFSFQYFEDRNLGKQVIQNLVQHTKPGGLILLGDIPDKRKWFRYYNSGKKLFSYFKQSIHGSNDMGKFWDAQELNSICNELGVEGTLIQQESWQPYSHYRFDYLIRI